MYLRIVRLRVSEGREAAFTRLYQESIIPALATTPGCLYVGLLAPWRGETYQSLTIWESSERALAYEESGLYHRLLTELSPFLADRTQWRVRRARDPLETADPSRREPPSDGYEVEAETGIAMFEPSGRLTFVRIVEVRIAPGRLEDFTKAYRQQVIPALEAFDGYRGVFLALAADDPEIALSITFWSREEDAVRYEMSGEFERLSERLKDTFSPLYDWGAHVGGTPAARAALKVSSYELVRGRPLRSGEEETG
jgi:heme-degrading monooxygenase HmoA